MSVLDFQLFQVDDHGQLFISPAFDAWDALAEHEIDTVIDLEGGLDYCIPTVPNSCLYIYFPIMDEELPNLTKLRTVARMAAALIRVGQGRASVADVRQALTSKTAAFKGEAAPARGLTLWNVPMGPERKQSKPRDRATDKQD